MFVFYKVLSKFYPNTEQCMQAKLGSCSFVVEFAVMGDVRVLQGSLWSPCS